MTSQQSKIWLIHHKARFGENSPMNYDGSEFALAIGVVAAPSLAQAVTLLDVFFESKVMELVDINSCEIYASNSFTDDLNESKEIRAGVGELDRRGVPVALACGKSSESAAAGVE